MPIDEVGEGSLPAKGVYGICLMRTGRAIDCNLFRPGATGGGQHGAKQREELRVT